MKKVIEPAVYLSSPLRLTQAFQLSMSKMVPWIYLLSPFFPIFPSKNGTIHLLKPETWGHSSPLPSNLPASAVGSISKHVSTLHYSSSLQPSPFAASFIFCQLTQGPLTAYLLSSNPCSRQQSEWL